MELNVQQTFVIFPHLCFESCTIHIYKKMRIIIIHPKIFYPLLDWPIFRQWRIFSGFNLTIQIEMLLYCICFPVFRLKTVTHLPSIWLTSLNTYALCRMHLLSDLGSIWHKLELGILNSNFPLFYPNIKFLANFSPKMLTLLISSLLNLKSTSLVTLLAANFRVFILRLWTVIHLPIIWSLKL